MLADKEEAKLADMVTGYGGWAQTFSTQTLPADLRVFLALRVYSYL